MSPNGGVLYRVAMIYYSNKFCLLIQNVIKSGQNMITVDFEVS